MSLHTGDKVTAKITGIQSYGVFVDINGEDRGLIHISECKDGFINDLHNLFKLGQTITAYIIDIDEFSGKISLSTRVNGVDKSVLDNRDRVVFHHPRYWTNYRLNHGFSPIRARQEEWLKEAIENFG
ncbi:CvfD/Ygs/GSP13 family RNA-binding post-transcriptional regulator [Lentilactobacillus sp. Marseille-Q4993]|uniref:CvfD/Ygs/GSP13 family RNA-binding post-transcriptional regulator n=1 Tax=Lentilactobacillus sp. Marseille-Q4993 TaxID=3039492 RepID=UPI0024BC5BE5|nr:CvfD/Ygs/GSP13 family RNA-binding post-transcriptional regulator [Lentilactobacillus sp. Marseille-Q4993]